MTAADHAIRRVIAGQYRDEKDILDAIAELNALEASANVSDLLRNERNMLLRNARRQELRIDELIAALAELEGVKDLTTANEAMQQEIRELKAELDRLREHNP